MLQNEDYEAFNNGSKNSNESSVLLVICSVVLIKKLFNESISNIISNLCWEMKNSIIDYLLKKKSKLFIVLINEAYIVLIYVPYICFPIHHKIGYCVWLDDWYRYKKGKRGHVDVLAIKQTPTCVSGKRCEIFTDCFRQK